MSAADDGGRGRPTVEERASRRETLERFGGNRFSVLLRVLRAGSRVPPEEPFEMRTEWHPVVWTLARVAVLGVALWVILAAGVRLWRENHVDVWSGPDSSVTSGLRLADCPVVNALYDDIYPTWVRFQGSIYRASGRAWPFVARVDPAAPWSGYRLGNLELDLIADSAEGRAGRTIALRFEGNLIGQLYLITPECS